MMRFGQFLKFCAWEYLLLFACTWALSQTLFDVFFTPPALQFGPVPPLACVALLALLFFASYRHDLVWKVGVCYVLLCAAAIAACMVMTGGGAPLEDVETNWFWGILTLLLCCTIGFLLTRKLAGAAVWFIGAVFACALVQFFYEQGELGWYLVVLLSSLALVVYKNGQEGVYKAQALRKVSTPAIAATAAGLVAVACGLSAAVWFGIVAPLNPPTADLHLITEFRTYKVEEVKGIGTTYMDPNVDMKSQNLQDGEPFTTDDLVVSDDATKVVPANAEATQRAQARKQQGGQNAGSAASGGVSGAFDPDDPDPERGPFSFTLPDLVVRLLMGLLLLVMLGIVGYFVWRRVHRRRRLARILDKDPRAQAQELYLFLQGRLARLGFDVPPGATLAVYAASNDEPTALISHGSGTTLPEITATYVKGAYGCAQPTEEELAGLVAYYRNFWKGARAHLGNIRYFFKSFGLG